jgi:hypothetical protein
VESVVVTDTFGLRTLIQPGITTWRTIALRGGGSSRESVVVFCAQPSTADTVLKTRAQP